MTNKSKMREILNLFESAGAVLELTSPEALQFVGKQVPHEYWTEGVMYNGRNVFDVVYNSGKLIDRLAKRMESSLAITSDDYQECYLGYDPAEDTFYMGFDGWKPRNDSNMGIVVAFKMDAAAGAMNGYSISKIYAIDDGMFYTKDNAYDELKDKLIGIRLD